MGSRVRGTRGAFLRVRADAVREVAQGAADPTTNDAHSEDAPMTNYRSLASLLFLFGLTLFSGCASTPANGAGVCCPRGDPCTHPASGVVTGGWAPNLASCPAPVWAFDGVWGDVLVNGCPSWEDRGILLHHDRGEVSCGFPNDAGADANRHDF